VTETFQVYYYRKRAIPIITDANANSRNTKAMVQASDFWVVAALPAVVDPVAPTDAPPLVVPTVPPVVKAPLCADAAVTVKAFPASDGVNVAPWP
jgi:hypothetical protein